MSEGTNEQIIDLIKQRLAKGQDEYGMEVPIQRERGLSNIEEAIDEILDLVVYLTAYLLEIKQDKVLKRIDVDKEEQHYIRMGLEKLREVYYNDNSWEEMHKVIELSNKLDITSK